MEIIDITQEIFGGKVYEGDIPPSYERVKRISDGDECNLTNIKMCVHNCTHIDAQCHYVDGGKSVEKIELNKVIGETLLIDRKRLPTALNEKVSKLIIKDAEELTLKEALMISESQIELIGISGQSVGNDEIHRILLSKEIVLLEGLSLDNAECGKYMLFAAPIKLGGSDGAPVRALLIR